MTEKSLSLARDLWDISIQLDSDIELLIERDQKGQVTKLGYSVRRRKSNKTFTEFRELVKKLVGGNSES